MRALTIILGMPAGREASAGGAPAGMVRPGVAPTAGRVSAGAGEAAGGAVAGMVPTSGRPVGLPPWPLDWVGVGTPLDGLPFDVAGTGAGLLFPGAGGAADDEPGAVAGLAPANVSLGAGSAEVQSMRPLFATPRRVRRANVSAKAEFH